MNDDRLVNRFGLPRFEDCFIFRPVNFNLSLVGVVVVGAVVVVVGEIVVVGAAVVDAGVSATSSGPDDPLQPPTVSSKAASNASGRYIRFGASGVPRGLRGHRV